MSGEATQLLFSAGGRFDGSAVRYSVAAGRVTEIYAGWVNRPTPTGASLHADGRTYASARRIVAHFWRTRLAGGAEYVVPERRVLDAELGVLTQQFVLGAHYSAGNTYEELSFAEVLDAAEVMARYGFADQAKAILRITLRALPGRSTNWRAGEQFVASALYFRLYRDRRFVEEETPGLATALAGLGTQVEQAAEGLLPRERYSSDISAQVYGLHGQATVREGLFAMARVWAQTGHVQLAARSRAFAVQLDASLRRAVQASMKRLPDGSLFVPVALLDPCVPFDRLTASREGSYWNLVMPYALASGLFAPHSPEADGLLRYLLGHGARLLGVVRADASGLDASRPGSASGIDQVYGLGVSRFLADNDQPDQLVLSLYGTLAVAMTPNTFVSGERSTVMPRANAYYRTMDRPPNLGGNATFLETLRVMLVQETRRPDGRPQGLELAFATPRAWLSDGKTIRVRNAPTSFGRVSFSITRRGRAVHVAVVAPTAPALRLRLRLPAGERIAAIHLAGRPVRYDAATGTIDLTGRTGHLELDAILER